MFDPTQIISASGNDPGEVARAQMSEDNLPAQQLGIMIDTIPAVAWSCFKDGSVEFLNKSWLAFTGLSQGVAAGWGKISTAVPGGGNIRRSHRVGGATGSK